MPCYITGSAEGDALLAARENNEKLLKQLQLVTRVACELAGYVVLNDEIHPAVSQRKLRELSKEAQNWVMEHRKVDKLKKRASRSKDRTAASEAADSGSSPGLPTK